MVAALHDVFTGVPHTMFCVKSLDGTYLAVNQAFAERAGVANPAMVLGRRAGELFPADLAESYESQDARVLTSGDAIRNELEMILRPDGSRGWYVTTKTRLHGANGSVIGIVAVSYDLSASGGMDARPVQLHAAVELARRRYADPVRVAELADAAGLTPAQLDRSLRRALGLSPKQLLLRARLDEAIRRLEDTDLSLAVIATECGYYDQSAFTRQFQAAVGMTPGRYRAEVHDRRARSSD